MFIITILFLLPPHFLVLLMDPSANAKQIIKKKNEFNARNKEMVRGGKENEKENNLIAIFLYSTPVPTCQNLIHEKNSPEFILQSLWIYFHIVPGHFATSTLG